MAHRARTAAALAIALAAVVAVVLLATGGGSEGDDGDLVCEPRSRPVATVLLLHPGGFVGGRAQDLRDECETFADNGYLAVSVAYSYRFEQALHDVAMTAERRGGEAEAAGRPLFAYGLSSGGTYAAMLAQRGDVDAAFSYAGVYDIAAWVGRGNQELLDEMDATAAELDRASPVNAPLRNPAPMLIGHNPADVIAPYSTAERMARRSPRFRLRTFREPSNGYAAHTIHPTATALRYFERYLRRRP